MGNVENRVPFPGAYLNIELTSHHFVAGQPVNGRITLRIGGLAPYISDKLQIMIRGTQLIKYDE